MMLRLLPGVIMLALTCQPLSVAAQSHNFRNYSVREGLPFIHVYEIFQDSRGYLWTGGYGGISRFDGRNFTNYSEKDGLPNNWVTSIAEDTQGRMWIGTRKGLAISNSSPWPDMRLTLNTLGTKDGLPDAEINDILVDRKGQVWVATPQGMAQWKDSSFIPATGLPAHINVQILRTGIKGRMWLGTTEGLYLLENGTYKAIDLGGSSRRTITAIFPDTLNREVWVGSEGTVYRIADREGKLSAEMRGTQEENETIHCFGRDLQGKRWMGTSRGLFRYEANGEFKRIPIQADVDRNLVQTICRDREGNLWLGTYDGLYRYRGDDFVTWQRKDGLRNSFVFQVMRDRKDRLWFATKKGVQYLEDGIPMSPDLPEVDAWAVFEDDDGTIWVGTEQGLFLYDAERKQYRQYTQKDGLRSDSVLYIFRSSNGIFWLGNHGGFTMCRKHGGTWLFEAFDLNPGKKDYDVWSILEDHNHDLWFGTFLGGLFKKTGSGFVNMVDSLHLRTNTYLSLVQDRHHTLYLGSLDGLYIYEEGKAIRNISTREGLSSDLIYSLGMDKDERYLWIGTNQGLNRLDIRTWRESGQAMIRHYGYEEGFLGVESNGPDSWLDKDGSLWFGTVNGLIRHNPDVSLTNQVRNKTLITGFQLFYTDTFPKQITRFPHDQNSMTFHFLGISMTRPDAVKYRYRLKGFEKDWSPPTSEQSARYPNLKPGTYTFEVISANNEGLWSHEPASYRFTIDTPYWLEWWFMTGSGFGLLFTTIGVVRYRIRMREKKQREEAEHEIRLATQELKAIRAQLNPHFVFNALNSIQHFVLNHHDESAGKYLNKFARLMRLILSNSEKSQVTVAEELEALNLFLELEVLRFEDKFSYTLSIDPDIDTHFYEIPPMLIQPYVENAVIHGLVPRGGGGKLEIYLSRTGNDLHISIRDNGIGRKKAQEMKAASSRREHRSMGMNLSRDRVEIFNRVLNTHITVAVQDVEEHGHICGTHVEIVVPIT